MDEEAGGGGGDFRERQPLLASTAPFRPSQQQQRHGSLLENEARERARAASLLKLQRQQQQQLVPAAKSKTLSRPEQLRWRSVRLMYLTTFLSSVGFSIVLSTLWPFLQKMDGSKAFLGYVVAAYSLGQFVASPIFGVWSNHARIKYPLIVSISINIVGNVMYSFTEAMPFNRPWAMLVARFIVGFGAGNVAVCRSYVAAATTMKERTPAMANMSAAQGLGFIVGPALGAAFSPLKTGIDTQYFEFDFLTGPGYISALFGILNLVVLLLWLSEHRLTEAQIAGLAPLPGADGAAVVAHSAHIAPTASYGTAQHSVASYSNGSGAPDDDDGDDTELDAALSEPSRGYNTSFTINDRPVPGPAAIAPAGSARSVPTSVTGAAAAVLDASAPTTVVSAVNGNAYSNSHHSHHHHARQHKATSSASINASEEEVTESDVEDQRPMLPRATTPPPPPSSTLLHSSAAAGAAAAAAASSSSVHVSLAHNADDDDAIKRSLSVKIDKFAVVLAVWGFFSVIFVFAVFETILTPLTMDEYDWTRQEADFYCGILFGVSGLVAVAVFMLVKPLALRLGERPLLLFGFGIMTLSFVAYMPWGPASSTRCDDNPWCATTPELSLPQFLAASAGVGIGYPVASVMIYTLYSKILGPKPQGVYMGIITATGSAARVLGPVFVTLLYDNYGPRWSFGIVAGILLFTVIVDVLFYNRFQEHPASRKKPVLDATITIAATTTSTNTTEGRRDHQP